MKVRLFCEFAAARSGCIWRFYKKYVGYCIDFQTILYMSRQSPWIVKGGYFAGQEEAKNYAGRRQQGESDHGKKHSE